MYVVGDSLPVSQLDPGTYLLVGPAMSGKYRLMLDILTAGVENGDAGLFVTTNVDAGSVMEDVADRTGEIPEHFHVIDCVADPQGLDREFPSERVTYVSSPADMTGIGIGVTEQLRKFTDDGVERIRVCMYSLSTLLMYTEIETVFRFVHVLTGRMDGMQALGLFALDPSPHEEREVNTLKQLFDGMIEVESGEAGSEFRIHGVSGSSGE